MPLTNSNILINKLDAFIRKYYKNQLIRGVLYFTGLMLFVFLLVILLAHFGEYGTFIRAVLFYLTVVTGLFLLIKYLFLPVRGLLKLGKTMSYEEASAIVGKHFPNISDRLLNTLQLMQKDVPNSGNEFLEAAIKQKTDQLKPIPFVAAIDLNANKRYAWWVIVPLVLYGIIFIVARVCRIVRVKCNLFNTRL